VNGDRGKLEFMSSLRNVVERLKGLETERKNLLLEIEELKKMADSKAKALESEISMLREEVKSLRVLLGTEETEPTFGQKKKK
jgi:predicted  nucleic acid-binding Zn-ribbon protein